MCLWCMTAIKQTLSLRVRCHNSAPLSRCPLGALRQAAGPETALWRRRLRQIVKGISHLFYQFTDLS